MSNSKHHTGSPPSSRTHHSSSHEPTAFDEEDASALHSHSHSPASTGAAQDVKGTAPATPSVDVPPMQDLATNAPDDDEDDQTNERGSHQGAGAQPAGAGARVDADLPPTEHNAKDNEATGESPPTSDPATEGRAMSGDHPSGSSTTAPGTDGDKAAEPTTGAPAAGGPPAGLPKHPAPDYITFHKNPDKDDFGFKAVFESMTNLQTIGWVRAALRTVAFVSFPMMTLAVHPNTMFRFGFPEMLIAAVVSTSTHRGTLGEQIGLHSWIWRGILYMLVFGTVMDAFQVQNHVGAWYGLLALGIFLAGLVSHGMMRRFMYLYFFIYMMEIRMFDYYFHSLPMNNASWSAADYYMGSAWGIAALCFPYPLLVKNLVDMIMTKIFAGLGKMFMAMVTFVWMPDPHAACLFFNDRMPFMTIEAILEVMPPLLWFANWEPTEFALRNPIRRIKLSLLRRIMALTYAAFGAGCTIVAIQKRQADLLAMHRIRVTLFQAMHGNDQKAIGDRSSVSHHANSDASHLTDEVSDEDAQAARASIAALRENSRGCVKDFALTLMQCTMLIGATLSTPEMLVKKVPFDALREKDTAMRRNLRLELIQVMKIQSDLVARRRSAEQQRKKLDEERDADDDDANNDVIVEDGNSPFGHTRHYRMGRTSAAIILEHGSIIDANEVFLRMNQIFFHLQMSMIAGEILSFGEDMKEYKPAKSLGRRLLEFFIIEPWRDFWEELWCRIAFVRPCDYRTVKDAIRMTCAYLSATALNLELYVTPGGLYFFGVTILLGLPVEEESLNMGVNRMAGNSLGCALGFMAYHNAHNLAQQLAMALCFTFIQQCCKNHPLYGQTFFYGSVITLAGLATSMVTMELLTRMIASCYTIIAYMLCCMFIFPNNSIKICWGYRCKLTKVMSEVVDDAALTLRIKPECFPEIIDDNNNDSVAYPQRNTEAMQMCSQLNVEMSLASRLLDMCDKWAPFAARQPIIRGMSPFPSAASSLIQFSHKRMVAHLRMLVFGVQLLHRPRTEPISSGTARLVAGSVADFLAEFSNCVRLLSQDFIDSVQISRKWSYPLSLSRTSQLSRLRVRLQAIHTEGYVTVLQYISKGTFGMTQQDFDELHHEAAERREEHPANELHVHVQAGESERDSQHNLSFADRFLAARRIGESFAGGPNAETLEQLHQSMYLTQPLAASTSMQNGSMAFAHRARLQESDVQPNDAFPFTQESAEREVQQQLREERLKEERARNTKAKSPHSTLHSHSGGADGASDHESHQPTYEPVMPQKTKSNVSKLILFPNQGAESYIPLYKGPAFTYVEDAFDTDRDTDFAAIMTILCSCDGLMTELEGLTGPVNSINTYQKQLHESSIAVGFLDKVTEKLKAIKKENYERYHYPSPPPQKRDALHAQSDPWVDWRF